jgi:hypothetical protein
MKDSKFVICIDNSGYPASLERRKLYEILPDSDAKKFGQVRVIDESGDDYLYPSSYFVDANLSEETRNAVTRAV